LISEKHIATNRHCVFKDDPPTELASRDFYFIRNPLGDDYQAEAFTATLVQDGSAASGGTDTAYDWAILELNYPIGREVGYVGFASANGLDLPSFRGTRPEISPLSPFEDPYKNLCRDTRNPFADFKTLADSTPKDPKWFVPPISLVNPPMLCLSGYPGDVGDMNQVLSQQCTFVGGTGLSYLHDCATTRGSSGSPIFYLEDDGSIKVVSINRAGYRPGDVSVMNAPINMNNTNVGTENILLLTEVARVRISEMNLLPMFLSQF
jgi:hypothetical protein